MLFMHKNYQTDGFKLKRGEKKVISNTRSSFSNEINLTGNDQIRVLSLLSCWSHENCIQNPCILGSKMKPGKKLAAIVNIFFFISFYNKIFILIQRNFVEKL